MYKIACFGDNCIDYYDQSQQVFYGGNPVNVAVYTKRIGFSSSYIGVVGNDKFGEGMRKALLSKGIDCSHLHQKVGSTALTHVFIANGERIFGDYEEGVMADFSLTEEDISFIAEHDFAVTGLWGHCENQLEQLKKRGCSIAFDAAEKPEDSVVEVALPFIDILFFSDDKSSDEFLKNRMKKIAEKGVGLIVATRAERGSLLYDGAQFLRQGILEVKVVDTMGAGDSFIAGFLSAYLLKKTLSECLMSGAQCSAVTLSYKGAW